MGAARDTFVKHAENPEVDPYVAELRRSLAKAKMETLQQVEGLDDAGLTLVMPGLYQQIISTTIQMAASVGLGVGLALEALDESETGVSISSFNRQTRQQMTQTGVEMKRRHSSRIAKLVAEVEAQRLAWRHNHEFLSWLTFRRGDERYPAADRRDRMVAFKVQPRLLQSREVVSRLLGRELAVALEAHDRFQLANRWKLGPEPEHAVERFAWPILSYQPETIVLLETARYDFDAKDGAGPEELEPARQVLHQMFFDQLGRALDGLPAGDIMGAIV